MEIVASGHSGGARDKTGADSSTVVALDLSEFENRWVELWFDQDAEIAWATTATNPTIASTSAAVSANVDSATPTNVGRKVPAETYVSRFVRRPNSFLLYRAQSTSITIVEVIPTSPKQVF